MQIPPSVRLTLDQLLDLADQAESRAQHVAWMSKSSTFTKQPPVSAPSLHRMAFELRRTSERLIAMSLVH